LEETGGVRGGWDEYDHQTFPQYFISQIEVDIGCTVKAV
jgi:hypothetical protein